MRKRRAPCVNCVTEKGEPKEQKRKPGQRVVLKRSRKRNAGTARKVSRVTCPPRDRDKRAGNDARQKAELTDRAVMLGNDQRVPAEETKRQTGERNADECRPSSDEQVGEVNAL